MMERNEDSFTQAQHRLDAIMQQFLGSKQKQLDVIYQLPKKQYKEFSDFL